jgi:hypothetical protein
MVVEEWGNTDKVMLRIGRGHAAAAAAAASSRNYQRWFQLEMLLLHHHLEHFCLSVCLVCLYALSVTAPRQIHIVVNLAMLSLALCCPSVRRSGHFQVTTQEGLQCK